MALSSLSFLTPAPFTNYQTRDGGKFTSDANGLISGTGLSGVSIQDLLAAGAVPVMSAPAVAPGAYHNYLDGGDFSTNPWQRNIAGLATGGSNTTAISNTFTYFPDRFGAVGAATSAIQLTQTPDLTIPGFSQSCLFSRKSGNSDLNVLNFGSVVNPADVARLQGQSLAFSFWARAAAGYSGGLLNVAVPCGTGNLANCTAANMMSGAWTGQANTMTSSIALTAAMTRYTFSGVLPMGSTELGCQLSWTPTGTAGAADGVYVNGFQLEGGSLSPFQFRDIMSDYQRCLRYCWVIPEPANNVPIMNGATTTANNQVFFLETLVPFVKVPAVTLGAGSWKVSAGAAFAAAVGLSAPAGAQSQFGLSLATTQTATAGLGALVAGGGGNGYILASADY